MNNSSSKRPSISDLRKLYDFTYVRKYLLRRFAKNDIDRLNEDLQNFKMSTDSIYKFFDSEINEIVEWVLIYSKNNQSFKFIYDNCPHEIFQKGLRNNDFSTLKMVLEARRAEEKMGFLTFEKRREDCERLKLLIQIDPKGMELFMQKWNNAPFMGKSILEDYEWCLKNA